MLQDITERKRLDEDRVRLRDRERAAHREMEATLAKLQALQALTDTALSHLALDDLLRELLARLREAMAADNAAILLTDDDRQHLTLYAAHGPEEQVMGTVRIPMGKGVAGGIATSGCPLIIDDLSKVEVVNPLLRATMHALVGVPLFVDGEVRGVIHVDRAGPRRFSETDMHLLQRAADRIALAIDRARLYAAEQDARHRAEAALAQAQASEARAAARAEQLHTVLDTIADGVLVLDAEGRIQAINRAYRDLHALERAPAGYEALPLRERIGPLDGRDASTGAPLPIEAWPGARALRGEVVTGNGADLRVRAFDGRELEMNASAAPLREPDGRIAGAVVVLRDLSERNRLARERAEARADEVATGEANRHLEAFLATAAHDLRSPLTAVVGYLALAEGQTERLALAVQERCPDLAASVEAVRHRLDDVGQGAKRLTQMLSVLFDVVAIRAGKLELHRTPADLATLVREQVDAQRVSSLDRTIRLRLPSAGAPIAVEVDADRIREVVANYLANALKYSPPDRPIDVCVVARAVRARVTVRDQGPGLPREERARIWEGFHRAPGVAAQGGAHGGSLGLGLPICKALVTAHGGRVGVQSTVGEGSVFWFSLPLATL